jgi:glycosyltransferase involved in cell wall biosynthesis
VAHIACFIQHYHTPDCPTAARPYSLIQHLARRHEVTLITSDAWRKRRRTSDFDWVPSSVRLVELPVPYGNRMGTARRFVAFASYAARALRAGLSVPTPDVVFGTSTPLSTGVVAALVARWHGVPWVFEVRDLWPDFPIQMGAISSPLVQQALYRLERWMYRDAAHVVALSPDMARHVRRVPNAAPVSMNPYGTDLALVDRVPTAAETRLRARYDLAETRVVVYAGSFGRANAIPTLLEAAQRFHGQASAPRDVRFVFAGDGYHRSAIETASQQCATIRLLPPLPRREALTLFRLAAISVVSFLDRPVLAANAPGKLCDSLAAGTPIVVTNPGWTRDLVEQYRCGWYVPPESPDHLARCIETVMAQPAALRVRSDNAQGLARRQFDRAALMNTYAQLAADVALGSGRPVPP